MDRHFNGVHNQTRMITGAQQVWETALGQLQLQVARPSYETWLKETVGLSLDQDLLTVGVPTPFAAEWLERRMYQLIHRTVKGIAQQSLHLRFQVVSHRVGNGPTDYFSPDSKSDLVDVDGPGTASPKPISFSNGNGHALGVNGRYTFESFIVGPSNQLAYAAASTVASSPGQAYNPLFIYSDVGLGKTHLLHALAHAAAQSDLNYLYVTTEQFTNDFIRALRGRKTEEFRAKYRSVDLLLVDDIQFIAGKEQTQEVFFHTFNDLHNANRQIVVTCDRSPKTLPAVEDRLLSRFEWGLIADIQPPDLETRIAILKTKATQLGILVGDGVIELIAERVYSNIRELEGSLNRLAAWAQFKDKPITLDLASVALPDLVKASTRRRITPQAVIDIVANHYEVPAESITGRSRDRRITLARQVAISLLAREKLLNAVAICSLFGNRDKSMLSRACTKVASLQSTSPEFHKELTFLTGLLA